MLFQCIILEHHWVVLRDWVLLHSSLGSIITTDRSSTAEIGSDGYQHILGTTFCISIQFWQLAMCRRLVVFNHIFCNMSCHHGFRMYSILWTRLTFAFWTSHKKEISASRGHQMYKLKVMMWRSCLVRCAKTNKKKWWKISSFGWQHLHHNHSSVVFLQICIFWGLEIPS